MVMIFLSGRLMRFRAEYSVVDFPLPVGPVTRKMPCGKLVKCSMRESIRSSKPSLRRS